MTGPTLTETGLFNKKFLTALVDEHQSGIREHSAVLWSLLMFESFLRQVHVGSGAAGGDRTAGDDAHSFGQA